MAANENSVFSDANGFRDSARPHALERSRREPRAVSIYKLPTGICEYAVVEEQQISIGQLDEIRFRYGLAAENRQRIRPRASVVVREEEHHLHIAYIIELHRCSNRILAVLSPLGRARRRKH